MLDNGRMQLTGMERDESICVEKQDLSQLQAQDSCHCTSSRAGEHTTEKQDLAQWSP
jgi:hypothetical protein